jgi:hypothetical protein
MLKKTNFEATAFDNTELLFMNSHRPSLVAKKIFLSNTNSKHCNLKESCMFQSSNIHKVAITSHVLSVWLLLLLPPFWPLWQPSQLFLVPIAVAASVLELS